MSSPPQNPASSLGLHLRPGRGLTVVDRGVPRAISLSEAGVRLVVSPKRVSGGQGHRLSRLGCSSQAGLSWMQREPERGCQPACSPPALEMTGVVSAKSEPGGAAESPGVGGGGGLAPGGRPVLDEQPGPGRHLSPATMDGRMPQMGAAAGREAEKGGPPRRLLATEAEEPGVGAREERTTDAAGVRGRRGGLCTQETSRRAQAPSLETPGTEGAPRGAPCPAACGRRGGRRSPAVGRRGVSTSGPSGAEACGGWGARAA